MGVGVSFSFRNIKTHTHTLFTNDKSSLYASDAPAKLRSIVVLEKLPRQKVARHGRIGLGETGVLLQPILRVGMRLSYISRFLCHFGVEWVMFIW